MVETHLEPALSRFYDLLAEVPEVARFFDGKAHMDRAQGKQAGHWGAIASGQLDADYFASSTKVGLRHALIGLEPRWHIGGYGLIMETLVKGMVHDMMEQATQPEKGRFGRMVPRDGAAVLELDLTPGRSVERLARDLERQPAKARFSNRLRKGAGLDGVKLGLLRELDRDVAGLAPLHLAQRIKCLNLPLRRTRPMEEAISVAGGVIWGEVNDDFMLASLPGLFVAGEMLDWEAPTGGYLLTACFATGKVAGMAAARFAGAA